LVVLSLAILIFVPMAYIPGTQTNIASLSEYREKAVNLARTGFPCGINPGFHSAKGKLSFLKKYSTIMYGPPHSGKSQVVKEFAVNMSREFGVKHLIRVPEWGRPEAAYVDIMQTYLGRKLFDNPQQVENLEELDEAFNFVEKHFLILHRKKDDPEPTLISDYHAIQTLKDRNRFIPDFYWCDHFKWLGRPEEWRNLKTDEYVTKSMQCIVSNSDELEIHTVMVLHTAQIDLVTDKDTGKRYLPKPTMYEIAGGQEWSKNGQQILSVYRPVEGIEDKETGMIYKKNQTIVCVDKSVPKGIGEQGTQIILNFDKDKQKYYEIINDDIYYGWEYEKGKVQPEPISNVPLKLPGEVLDLPF
jgi:hypothetical protein